MSNILVKTPDQILQDMLRTYANGLISVVGIPNPAIDPSSEIFLRFTAVANQLAIGMQNITIAEQSLAYDTATGTDLDRIVGYYGLNRRSPTTGSGSISITCNQATFVPSTAQLISNVGLLYQVKVGGTFNNGDNIDVVSIDTGAAVNLAVGQVLTWISTPAFTQPAALVSIEITGGADTEDDDTLRTRLFNLLQNPPQFGNWKDIAKLIEEFEPNLIQKAFIYPAGSGPGSQHAAVMGYVNATAKTREIPSSKMTNITNFVVGNIPAYTDTTVTTVQDGYFDTSFNLAIPYPVGADNLGSGGGWLNFSPWPLTNATSTGHDGTTNFAFCYVSSVTSAPNFVVKAPSDSAPVAGITKIQWVDKSSWVVRQAIVVGPVDSSGNYNGQSGNSFTLNLDTPFSGVAVGDYIFPASQNANIYLSATLNHFAFLGPGEKATGIAALLPRALRRPRPNIAWNNAIDATMLKAVINSSPEVLDCNFYARRARPDQGSGTSPVTTLVPLSTGNTDEVGAAVPPPSTNGGGSIKFCPIIYVPNQIGWYPPSLS